jgi:CSLREA domain-containing protein
VWSGYLKGEDPAMSTRFLLAPGLFVVLLALAALAAPAAFADTFVVDTTDDDTGSCVQTPTHCSLRQAITATNQAAGADTINFNLPVFKPLFCGILCVPVFTTNPIQLSSLLPSISGQVTIDGTSQPRYAGNPMVEVRGTGTGNGLHLTANANNSVIRAIAVTSFETGIKLVSSSNLVAGSRIGVDMNGAARGNVRGILVEGDSNRIGDGTSSGRNVISGNSGTGVGICKSCNDPTTPGSGSNNTVAGNFIGTNVSGTSALGNQDGIVIRGLGFNTSFGVYEPGVSGNIIGGGSAGDRNVISGNRNSGLEISLAQFNIAGGNFLGLNAAGTAAVPNQGAGVLLNDAPSTTLGSAVRTLPCFVNGQVTSCRFTISTSNLISGNTGDGVRIFYTTHTHDVAVLGNTIGTNLTTAANLGNGGHGVNVSGGIGFKNNHVGDSEPIAGSPPNDNVIAFNHGAGVHVTTSSQVRGQSVRFNRIFANTALGIDLTPDGASANGTTITNFPALTTVTSNSSSTTVQGTLSSVGDTTFTLDFYSSPGCDGSGFGEADRFLGTTSVFMPHNSPPVPAQFSATFDTPLPVGSVVTATATAPDGTTSEFSACQGVT